MIAQDLSSYGTDLYGEHRLAALIDAMAEVEGVEWIRLHTLIRRTSPWTFSMSWPAGPQRVQKYLDIALQHSSDKMLKSHAQAYISSRDRTSARRNQTQSPRHKNPHHPYGRFPGKEEEDFDNLMDFVRNRRFDRMGAFAYSEEEDTYAARHYTDNVPEEVKQRRLDTLMALQQDISAELSGGAGREATSPPCRRAGRRLCSMPVGMGQSGGGSHFSRGMRRAAGRIHRSHRDTCRRVRSVCRDRSDTRRLHRQ